MIKFRRLSRYVCVPLMISVGLLSLPLLGSAESETETQLNLPQQHKALEILMLLAYEGDSESQYELSILFAEGVGVMVDHQEAFYWLQRAAEQEHAEAQYQLGSAYLNGKGVDPDRRKGLQWWQKAAEGGSHSARYHLGRAFLYGIGVARNLEKAERLLRLAVEAGSERATVLLQQIKSAGGVNTAASVLDWVRVGREGAWIYASFSRGSPMIERLLPGTRLTVQEQQGGWLRVAVPGGLPLWVEVEHVELQNNGRTATVRSNQTEARSESARSIDSPVLVWLLAGEELSVLQVRNAWVRVRVPERHVGWVEALAVHEEVKEDVGASASSLALVQPENASRDPSEENPIALEEPFTTPYTNGTIAAVVDPSLPQVEKQTTASDGPGGSTTAREPVGSRVAGGDSHGQSAAANSSAAVDEATEFSLIDAVVPVLAAVTEPVVGPNPLATAEERGETVGGDARGTTEGNRTRLLRSTPMGRNDYSWLFSRGEAALTIELTSATSEVLVRDFILGNDFREYVAYFKVSKGGRSWYTVLHGSYPDLAAVRQALRELPVNLDALRVRRIGALQEKICGQFDDLPVSKVEILLLHCPGIDR